MSWRVCVHVYLCACAMIGEKRMARGQTALHKGRTQEVGSGDGDGMRILESG